MEILRGENISYSEIPWEEINNQLGRKYFEQAEFLWKTISQFYLKIGIKFVAQDDEELYQVKQKCMFH